ncbi:MAG: hypothetical protein AAF845_07270 [Bacteroidota bacterium]
MSRLGVALALLLGALPLAAQDARLVLREAALAFRPVEQDTTGWEAILFDDQTLRLGEVLLALGPRDVETAALDFDPLTNAPFVSIEFGPEAGVAFEAITEGRIGEAVAIVFDSRVLTVPVIQSAIPGGRLQISGNFTVAEADRLAEQIREATAASGVGREAQWAEVRTAFDDATPSAAVRTFLAATGAQDWLSAARLMHPAALRFLLSEAEEGVEVAGDSLRMRGGIAADGGGWIPFSLALGDAGVGRPFDDLSDPEAVAVLLSTMSGGGFRSDVEVAGEAAEHPDRVHVLLAATEEDPLGPVPDGFARTIVLTTERIGDRWVVLLPEAGW